ncbi:hypothetical protein GPJ56_009921 [Histomonas meleagridis]|uniref:uncharacterized protein n=1 Tax=Histomonas meleagridis TaxID=135588 RepID=UPI003559BE38|nr:hypothetical protein GPJ56_009921 [Histomonas meleagridis]KAH0802771.1 hypothetical protein GO595_004278 [Histomonas meleagridis]
MACCGCKKEATLFELRKGVKKCAECICDQVGRSTMDLLKKGMKLISYPVHILVCVSGGPSSAFVWDLLSKRINTTLKGKSAVIKKLCAISSYDLDIPNLIHIPHFSLTEVVQYAIQNDFNCIVLGDNADHISLATLGAISCGRPDVIHWISTDDTTNYLPVSILRPARQCLESEIKFYCTQNNIKVDCSHSAFQNAFSFEANMLVAVGNDGHGGTPFAIQKMGERLPTIKYDFKCTNCGLPSPDEGICSICSSIGKFSQ